MGRAFGREYKPAEAGTYFAWLQDGASSDELAGLRQNVPGPVVAIIGRVFGGKYRSTIAPAWRGGRAPYCKSRSSRASHSCPLSDGCHGRCIRTVNRALTGDLRAAARVGTACQVPGGW
jgi:hypothetical protein